MLRSFDSWKAVAMPIEAARAGRPRSRDTAEIRAALAAWSGASLKESAPTIAVQCSRTRISEESMNREAAHAPALTTARQITRTTSARQRRRERLLIGAAPLVRGPRWTASVVVTRLYSAWSGYGGVSWRAGRR
ncbi:hypothetical protein ACFFX0_07880 [Citricoccus parietis]|uniref:Uncharacterized protein n=1 Tax=Citricoccus parietis TaxID=592307 RepID=A0ABV5FWS0_9MICC